VLVDRGFSFLRTYQYAFLLALAQVPGYLSAAWLVERWGRRATLAVYLTTSALFTWLFAVADTTAGLVTARALMSFFALGGAVCLHPGGLPNPRAGDRHGDGQRHDPGGRRLGPTGRWPAVAGLVDAALTVYAGAFLVGGLGVVAGRVETRGRALADTIEEPAAGDDTPPGDRPASGVGTSHDLRALELCRVPPLTTG